MNADTTNAQPRPTPQQKRELLQRVVASSQFRRSARLRDFLRYVGAAAIKDHPLEVHEQEIGEQVFGRSPDYNRGTDNIVRVNATELRKRIEIYFASEGVGEEITFQIPRGAYTPVFHWRSVRPPVEEQPRFDSPQPGSLEPAPQAEAAKASPRPWVWPASTALLGVVCLALLWMLHLNRVDEADERPAVMAFWKGFTRASLPGTSTDLVLPDESISLMEDILRRPITLSDYLDRSYLLAIETSTANEDRKADLREILNHNLVTLGAFHAAQQILTLPGLTSRFHLTAPRFYPADAMRRNNVVFFGGKKSNPWTGFFESTAAFTLEYDSVATQAYVLNHHPSADEPSEFRVSMGRNSLTGYAVISYLPNASQTGDVLILAGSDSDATGAAADFITSETSLRQLLKLFGAGSLPHFEVVLKTSRVSGTSFNAEIIASRRR